MMTSSNYEHSRCFNYTHSDKPQIELIRFSKGEKAEFLIGANEIVFFLKGSIRYIFHNYPENDITSEMILFLPTGFRWCYWIESDTEILRFRLYNPIKLCEYYFIEHLFDSNIENNNQNQAQELKTLEINQRLWQFTYGLIECLGDGIKCRHYFDLKIREFFLMLRTYYPKNELREFLSLILSQDTAFSEYVRNNRHRYSTVIALAESMKMTPRQFAKRFKKIFNKNPYEWIKEGKAATIHHEITTTNKPIKQIAFECGLGSIPQFTRFCKNELGETPANLRRNALKK